VDRSERRIAEAPKDLARRQVTQAPVDAGLEVAIKLRRADFELDVDLRLPAGGITVLFGASGSGKTSLLRCVAGLERGSGRVVLGSTVWQDDDRGVFVPTWARKLGYVFQEASLFEHLNVRENLEYGVRRVGRIEARTALAEALKLLGIEHLVARNASSLSGGERQRVAIARALATEPSILLLDEPLASLDPGRRREILPWLEALHKALRIPVLYVTHTMEELTRLADHVVLMHSGTAQASGALGSIFASPAAALFLGGEAGAILEGTVMALDSECHLYAIGLGADVFWIGVQGLQIGSRVRLHINASDVSLSLSEPVLSTIQNKVHGRIETIVDDRNPAYLIAEVRCADQPLLARISRRARAHLCLAVGTPVWCLVKAAALSGR